MKNFQTKMDRKSASLGTRQEVADLTKRAAGIIQEAVNTARELTGVDVWACIVGRSGDRAHVVDLGFTSLATLSTMADRIIYREKSIRAQAMREQGL